MSNNIKQFSPITQKRILTVIPLLVLVGFACFLLYMIYGLATETTTLVKTETCSIVGLDTGYRYAALNANCSGNMVHISTYKIINSYTNKLITTGVKDDVVCRTYHHDVRNFNTTECNFAE